jgi:Zn-finger nucleic acid-binding protein
MPLILCPNDNSQMQAVSRSGVEFDICPTCRGVWLDRGELEKLMLSAREEGGAEARGRIDTLREESRRYDPAPPPQPRYQEPPRHPQDRGYGHGRWDDDDYRRKKRKGFDIFDIFD